ncbi:MAG: hypothetical protein JXR76_22440 [Deltaproteobacteria bacterium]|nr:hypothetical protein [Deltaproteobacteria bacterium]
MVLLDWVVEALDAVTRLLGKWGCYWRGFERYYTYAMVIGRFAAVIVRL